MNSHATSPKMQAALCVMLTALVATSVAYYARIPYNLKAYDRVSRSYYNKIPIDTDNIILSINDKRRFGEGPLPWCCPIPDIIPVLYDELKCNDRKEMECKQGSYTRIRNLDEEVEQCLECYRPPGEKCNIEFEDVRCVAGSKCWKGNCSGVYDTLHTRRHGRRDGWGWGNFDTEK